MMKKFTLMFLCLALMLSAFALASCDEDNKKEETSKEETTEGGETTTDGGANTDDDKSTEGSTTSGDSRGDENADQDTTTTEETKPEDTKPEDTKPEETKPEGTASGNTRPYDTKPQETKPQETKPQDTNSQGTQTGGAQTGDSGWGQTSPVQTPPPYVDPEETAEENSRPNGGRPGAGESSAAEYEELANSLISGSSFTHHSVFEAASFASLNPDTVFQFMMRFYDFSRFEHIDEKSDGEGGFYEITVTRVPLDFTEAYAYDVFGYNYNFASLVKQNEWDTTYYDADTDEVCFEKFGGWGGADTYYMYTGEYEVSGNTVTLKINYMQRDWENEDNDSVISSHTATCEKLDNGNWRFISFTKNSR